jgi:inorganic triphosphatase YgiF
MTEIEMKFRSSREAHSSLMDLAGLSPDYVFEKASHLEIHDIYFDTEDHLLLKQGASLRQRKTGDILKVTLKAYPSTEGARITRTEMEQSVSEAESRALLERGQPPVFCASLARDMIDHKTLKPGLRVLNSRTVRKISHKLRGVVAEMSLDRVLFVLNGKEMPYEGVEVELSDNGTKADLEAISDILMQRLPDLAPDVESKFEKGMRLLS